MASNPVVGVDLGGTNINTVLTDGEGKVLARDKRPTEGQAGPKVVLGHVADSVRAVLKVGNLGPGDLLAVGIGSPGPLNSREGIVVTAPNLKGWANVPVVKTLSDELHVKVFLDNDANAAAFGESWLGAGRSVGSLIVMTLGTGLGGGLILNNALWRGLDDTGGEVGHMTVVIDGRQCNCGNKGCLERYGSATGIVITAKELIAAGARSRLPEMVGGNLNQLTSRHVGEAAKVADEAAIETLRYTGMILGVACANLVNLLNLEMIIFSGGVIAVGDLLFEPVRQEVRKRAFSAPANRCHIMPAQLGDDAGALGAAGIALSHLGLIHKSVI